MSKKFQPNTLNRSVDRRSFLKGGLVAGGAAVVRSGDPRTGDWGVMIALGPGMAAEVALLRW